MVARDVRVNINPGHSGFLCQFTRRSFSPGKKLVKELQDAGAYVKIHICGDITHLLDGIADLGMDLLDVDHMVEMKEVREKVGRDVVITGNIDPVN